MKTLARLISYTTIEVYKEDKKGIAYKAKSNRLDLSDAISLKIDALIVSNDLCGFEQASVKSSEGLDLEAFLFAKERLDSPTTYLWCNAFLTGDQVSQAWTKKEQVLAVLDKLNLSKWTPIFLEPISAQFQHYPGMLSGNSGEWRFQEQGKLPLLTNDVNQDCSDQPFVLNNNGVVNPKLLGAKLLDRHLSSTFSATSLVLASALGVAIGIAPLLGVTNNSSGQLSQKHSNAEISYFVDTNLLGNEEISKINAIELSYSSGLVKVTLDPLAVPPPGWEGQAKINKNFVTFNTKEIKK